MTKSSDILTILNNNQSMCLDKKYVNTLNEFMDLVLRVVNALVNVYHIIVRGAFTPLQHSLYIGKYRGGYPWGNSDVYIKHLTRKIHRYH